MYIENQDYYCKNIQGCMIVLAIYARNTIIIASLSYYNSLHAVHEEI